MKTLLSGLMGAMLAASFAIASATPSNAAPVYVPQSEQMRADVAKVHNSWRADRRYNRWARRHAWRDRYYYGGDRYYSYRPRYYQRDYYPRYYYPRHYYPRYYRRPGFTLEFNFN